MSKVNQHVSMSSAAYTMLRNAAHRNDASRSAIIEVLITEFADRVKIHRGRLTGTLDECRSVKSLIKHGK